MSAMMTESPFSDQRMAVALLGLWLTHVEDFDQNLEEILALLGHRTAFFLDFFYAFDRPKVVLDFVGLSGLRDFKGVGIHFIF